MTNRAMDPASLDILAATVGLSVRGTDKADVSALLSSIRESVVRTADALPVDSPPALFFDPR